MERLRAEFERDVKNLYPLATLARVENGAYLEPQIAKCWDFYAKAHQCGYIAGGDSVNKTVTAWRPVIMAAIDLVTKPGFWDVAELFAQHKPEIVALESALVEAGLIVKNRKPEDL